MNKKLNNQKLKIGFLDLDDVKNILLNGGQAKTTYEIGKILVKKGHQVTVYCSKYPGYKDRFDKGIYYKHIGANTKNIKINNFLYVLIAPLYSIFIKDDILVECFTAPVSTLLSPLFTRACVVGLGTSFEADRFSKLYHFPFYLIEKYGAKLYKYFISYNPTHEEKMRSLNPKTVIRTIPEGVEEIFINLKRNKGKHILFVGRFDIHQKGIDLLLNAYAKVINKIKYPLIIVGFGPDKEKIEKMVKDLKLTSNVKLLGGVYGDAKLKLLSDSIFVCVPSRSESFSLFTLEAIASGNPVVIFNIPGLSWVSQKVSLRTPIYNEEKYGENMLKLLNTKINNEKSKAAKTFSKNFTWEKVTDEFEDFFYEILKRERKGKENEK